MLFTQLLHAHTLTAGERSRVFAPAAMLPTSNSKIGQISAPSKAPAKRANPLNVNDESYWREQRMAACATLANETLPPMLFLSIGIIGAKPETRSLRLSNASIRDEHLPPLLEILYHSECALLELDLAFNQLTDAGLRMLCDALCRKLNEADWHACAFELTHIFLGGNEISPEAVDEANGRLKQAGRDIQIDCTAQLRGAAPLCNVTAVYDGGPASSAGIRVSDQIVAFGPLHTPKTPEKGFKSNPQRQFDAIVYFKNVAFSMGPVVKECTDKPISVIVQRAAAAGDEGAASKVQYVQLTLVPKKWDGQGLTGCKLVEVPTE